MLVQHPTTSTSAAMNPPTLDLSEIPPSQEVSRRCETEGNRSQSERFQCDKCSKLCMSKEGLKRHMTACRKEGGISVTLIFDCDLCKKSFNSERYLKQHRGKGKCLEKSKSLSLRLNITESNAGEEMSTCPFCSKLFKSRGLMKHMKSSHRECLLAELYSSKGQAEKEKETEESVEESVEAMPGNYEVKTMDLKNTPEDQVVDMEVDMEQGEKEKNASESANMDVDEPVPEKDVEHEVGERMLKIINPNH